MTEATEAEEPPPIPIEGRLQVAVLNHASAQRWLSRGFLLIVLLFVPLCGGGFATLQDPGYIICPGVVIVPVSLVFWRSFGAAANASTQIFDEATEQPNLAVNTWVAKSASAFGLALALMLMAHFFAFVALVAVVLGD